MGLFTGIGSLIMTGADSRVYDCEFSTAATINSASIILQGARGRVENCFIYGAEVGVNVQEDEALVTNNHISAGGIGVNIDGNRAVVEANNIEIVEDGVSGVWGILINSGDGSRVIGNSVTMTPDVAVGIESSGNSPTVVGNVINVALDQTGISVFDGGVIANNTIRGSGVTSAGAGILLNNFVAELVLVGNRILFVFTGIVADGTSLTDVLIADNLVEFPEGHGIDMAPATSAQRLVIQGNLVVNAGQDAANTYDGIRVSSNRAHVFNNVINPDNSPATRSAVNITAGTGVIVVGNDFGPTGTYGTDALIDGGTSTVLVYPADATYGDNFF